MAVKQPTPFLTLRSTLHERVDVVDIDAGFLVRRVTFDFNGSATNEIIVLSNEEADNMRSWIREQRPESPQATIH